MFSNGGEWCLENFCVLEIFDLMLKFQKDCFFVFYLFFSFIFLCFSVGFLYKRLVKIVCFFDCL